MHKFTATILALGTIFSLFSCGQDAPAAAEAASPTHTKDGDEIPFTAAQIKTAAITWAEPEMRQVTDKISVSGEWKIHNEHIAIASAVTPGVITDLRTGLNKPVRKGETIAIVRNPELIDLQQDYLQNSGQMSFLQAEYDRYKSLKDDNATALKNWQKAESELKLAQTNGSALAAKLRLYGISPEQLSPENLRTEIAIVAPISGIITHTLTNTGASVSPGTPICEIVNTQAGHADFYVFQKDIARVKIGQKISVKSDGSGAKAAEATIFSIDQSVLAEKNAICVHAQMSKSDGNFAPASNSYLAGEIESSGKQITVPALPAEAVSLEEDGNFVYMVSSENADQTHFKRVAVRTQSAGLGWVGIEPVEGDWPAHAKFVVKGLYYVAAQAKGVEAE